MSNWVKPMVAAKNAVAAPTRVTTALAVGASSNSGERRQTMNTPAVTMVAAWIRALTGVGPSMASGSQVCRKNWADLPMAPTNSSAQARSSRFQVWPAKAQDWCRWAGTAANTSENLIEPNAQNTVMM